MGVFAGWDMPLQYTGVGDEHRAVRERLGIFDVSHMGQIALTGDGARAYLGEVLTNDVERLTPGLGQYTLVCREDGGTIDDLILYQLADAYLIVCNASNVAPVRDWLTSRAPADVTVTDRSADYAMLALQGREWEAALRPLVDVEAISSLPYFGVALARVAGAESLVARTGYTGEPGVEIMCPADRALDVWDALLAGAVAPTPAGLVARDTLRLEMGYPLYGQELSLTRTPIEAGLKWACDLDGGFVGADVMRAQAVDGVQERLCSFTLGEPGIPRPDCPVVSGGEVVGSVTSGTMSPTLGIGVGMAYVRSDLAAVGTSVAIDIRGKLKSATIAKRPLVDTSPTKE